MTQHTLVITDYELPGNAAERAFAEEGHRVIHAASREPEDIIASARDASALLVQWANITPDIMDALPKLRIISRLGIGYDMIDVPAATERGIAVANTPTYCVEEVAAHTLAMTLSLTRGLPAYHDRVHAGTWAPTDARPMVVRPSATTVGIVGYGRIGALVAQHCAAIGFRVLVVDPFVTQERVTGAGLSAATLTEALKQADVLSLHLPLNTDTHRLINAETIAAMRPGAVIINTCRGPLIDEDALASSLRNGHTGAAALDVFDGEPLRDDSPLRELKNVILSPHAAWYSPQALADLPIHGARNINQYLNGQQLASIVNPDYRKIQRVEGHQGDRSH